MANLIVDFRTGADAKCQWEIGIDMTDTCLWLAESEGCHRVIAAE